MPFRRKPRNTSKPDAKRTPKEPSPDAPRMNQRSPRPGCGHDHAPRRLAPARSPSGYNQIPPRIPKRRPPSGIPPQAPQRSQAQSQNRPQGTLPRRPPHDQRRPRCQSLHHRARRPLTPLLPKRYNQIPPRIPKRRPQVVFRRKPRNDAKLKAKSDDKDAPKEPFPRRSPHDQRRPRRQSLHHRARRALSSPHPQHLH